jgi:hypothetical protein
VRFFDFVITSSSVFLNIFRSKKDWFPDFENLQNLNNLWFQASESFKDSPVGFMNEPVTELRVIFLMGFVRIMV